MIVMVYLCYLAPSSYFSFPKKLFRICVTLLSFIKYLFSVMNQILLAILELDLLKTRFPNSTSLILCYFMVLQLIFHQIRSLNFKYNLLISFIIGKRYNLSNRKWPAFFEFFKRSLWVHYLVFMNSIFQFIIR